MRNDSEQAGVPPGFERGQQAAIITVMTLIDLTAVSMNILWIGLILRLRHLRQSMTYICVLNLNFVDLVASLTIVPSSIYAFTVEERHVAFCGVFGFLVTMFTLTSIFSVCLVGMERYVCIRYPMTYHDIVTPRKTAASICTVWAAALILSFCPVLGWGSYTYQPNGGRCSISHDSRPGNGSFVLIWSLFGFVIPGSMMLVTYVKIFLVARKASKSIQPSNVLIDAHNSVNIFIISRQIDPEIVSVTSGDCGDWETSDCRPRSENMAAYADTSPTFTASKAAKRLLLVFSAFLLLWAPTFVQNVSIVLWGSKDSQWQLFIAWMGYSTFAINPVLYGWLNKSLRKELRDCFVKIVCCGTKAPEVRDGVREECERGENFYQFLKRTSDGDNGDEDTGKRR